MVLRKKYLFLHTFCILKLKTNYNIPYSTKDKLKKKKRKENKQERKKTLNETKTHQQCDILEKKN